MIKSIEEIIDQIFPGANLSSAQRDFCKMMIESMVRVIAKQMVDEVFDQIKRGAIKFSSGGRV